MKQENNTCEESSEKVCDNRRGFLVKATATVGGLMLSLSSVGNAQKKEDDKMKTAANADEFVLKLDEKSPLSKVGGSDTLDTIAGKVIVVRTGEIDFKAFAAICPHKGGPIKYDEKTSQLFCPWHGSRFDAAGKVIKGPAKTDLLPYQTEKAVVIDLKPQA